MSDVVDGFIAKNFNARTDLGAYLDPLADKVLLDGIYLALAILGGLPAWLALMVIGRDLLIVVGVVLIQRRNPVFRAVPLAIGKINTFAQILLAACAIAHAGGWIDLERAGGGADRAGREHDVPVGRRLCGAGDPGNGAGARYLSHARRLALLGFVPLLIFLLGLILFREILLPFLVGMAAAYLLDPAADRLQRWGLGRTTATLADHGRAS